MELTHLNENGKPRMVDVSAKSDTERTALARGYICMKPETIAMITDTGIAKGDVLSAAQIAGIMAAKQTGSLIPMCHPLTLTGVDMNLTVGADRVNIEATVKTTGKTGVEMEALTAVSLAALTIYDMCKAVDKGMIIGGIKLISKTGGKSGDFHL